MKPSEYPVDYYSFEKYNTKQRMLTYWHQIDQVLSCQPTSILEIGVGTGLVSSYLRHLGIDVTTLDINPSLNPDIIGSVLELESLVHKQFDMVLCARVLHHLPFEQFPDAIRQIAIVAGKNAVITLPMEDFRLYFMFRYTSSSIRTFSLPIPLIMKKYFLQMSGKIHATKYQSGLWKINDFSGVRLQQIQNTIEKYWNILEQFRIPEDSAHYLLKLQKKQNQ